MEEGAEKREAIGILYLRSVDNWYHMTLHSVLICKDVLGSVYHLLSYMIQVFILVL